MALFEIMMELGIFVLVGPEKYGTIYYRIRYLIGQKGGITYFFSHNNSRIKIDSYS